LIIDESSKAILLYTFKPFGKFTQRYHNRRIVADEREKIAGLLVNNVQDLGRTLAKAIDLRNKK